MLTQDLSLQPPRVVVISGLSGSGKSTAIRALEDIGFFCIDNLPIVLLPKLVELFPRSPNEIEQIGLVVDAREERFLDQFQISLDRIRQTGSRVQVVFLKCTEETLIRRYNETRRRHPLAADGNIADGIRKERVILESLAEAADQVLDTSNMNPHQLRAAMQKYFTQVQPGHPMNLTLVSFGFKRGLPANADLVFDVRFLANPYFVPDLRDRTGCDPEVASFVFASKEVELFLDHVIRFIQTFRPLYDREGKSYLTVGIGCTGGRHRSVAIVEELAKRLQKTGGPLSVHHLDMDGGER